ncbi:MAG: hypothetical protein ACI4Q4_00040 [Oscillospiraceae bacterium]
MKRYISVVLALVVFFICAVSAFAAASTWDIGSATKSSTLNISSTTATCKSEYSDRTGSTTRVEITQTLEKQGFLWIWSTYAGEWTKTTNGSSAALSNKVYNLESGKYRVKTVFSVTVDGETTDYTVYSTEKTV